MDNSAQVPPPLLSEEKQFLTPYQQQQMDSWKNRIKKFFIDAAPYFYRFFNEFMLILLKVVRGSIRIAKEQLLRN